MQYIYSVDLDFSKVSELFSRATFIQNKNFST